MEKSSVPATRRKKFKEDTGFPGGKLEEESPEEALQEIHEELNSQIEIISFVNEAS
ncbi:MAG: NUDIX domain-containing protein [Streptococcus salivarius]